MCLPQLEKFDFLYTNFSHNYPPISIPFSTEKHPILLNLVAFYHNLLKIHPIYIILAPSFLMKTHWSLYQTAKRLGESWSPQNHSYPEKMFPSNVLISLEAEKNPLSLIENPHKSPFRNFFYDHSKVELFSFLCSNYYKKILSITRQRKDPTAVAQLTLFFERSRFLP